MRTLIGTLIVVFLQILFSLIAAYVGWGTTDLLSFSDWFNVCFVGTMIVRAGFWLEELANDLTRKKDAPPLDGRGFI